ncbi:MAG: YfcE family phosphodiesterase [Clostridia bacterium]|nr:YfcE family phosphodiesterase [Clostridia bacterium]
MRIVVMSDCHGRTLPIEEAIERSNPDVFIYCGDGTEKAEEVSFYNQDIRFYFVKGNCDFGDYPIEQEIKLAGKTVFFTHGHKYSVKSGTARIIEEGKRRKADIVLFGHTHEELNKYIDGMYLINPGSGGMSLHPTYAFIEIIGKDIVTNIVEL